MRGSCNDFDGIQKKLNELLKSDFKNNKNLKDLITLHEYMVPSYSLDLLTLIIIAAGNMKITKKFDYCSTESEANILKNDHELDQIVDGSSSSNKGCSKCKMVNQLEIFDLLRWINLT